MATIIVPIPDQYVAPIAAALRPSVPDAHLLADADVIEAYARSVIETLVIQHAGSQAVATLDAQRDAVRQAAQAEARAMLDAVREADEG